MNDVAADAGVSLKTVSRVINGVTTVDPALVTRVNASIARLGFRRNEMAASLRSGSSSLIGLMTADLTNTFYMTIASAIASVATRHGLQVIMASTDEDPDTERRIAMDLFVRRIAGLIIVPSGSDQSYLEPEVRLGTPVVFLDRPGRGFAADSVLIDNHGGAHSAVTELVAKGHRRIAMLFDALSIYTMAERRRGAYDALREAGVGVVPELTTTDAHAPEPAAAAMARMLELADPPTAVFCANNRATAGALEAILARGADIEVIGFDDFELSRLLPRAIRIVDYDSAGLGVLAADILLERLAGSDRPPAEHNLPTWLVDRGGAGDRGVTLGRASAPRGSGDRAPD